MSDTSKRKGFFNKVKIEYILVVVFAIIGMLLIFGGTDSNKQTAESEIDQYVSDLENKLKKSFSQVEGAGKVDVIISVRSNKETVVATEKITEGNKVTETPILVGGKTVVLTENYPEIVGVVIVTKGADDLSLRLSLINSASVFLNVSKDKIQVLKR